jgi:23S rRNA (uracil1939-C5)-methyltransferase
MDLALGHKITLSILRLGIYGEGVGSHEGLTLFVAGALPGETVEGEVVELKKQYGRVKLTRIITPSPDRVAPPCPVFGRCGGCQLQHLSYAAQLKAKQQRVIDALERVGKLSVNVEPTIPSPSPWHYRNKIQMPSRNGILGLYAMDSHDLVEVEACLIHCPLGEKVLKAVRTLSIPHLKYLIIKTAIYTHEALVVLVTEKSLPKSIGEKILKLLPEIKGVVQNINPGTGNVILGKNFDVLAGEGVIEEHLCGLRFNISPASFFQVNPPQAEALYKRAIDLLNLTGKEVLLDAFCGVGTLSLIAASKAKQVIGVEIVPEAIRDAKENARINNIHNALFHCAAAEDYIRSVRGVDAVLLNPPRKGCEASLLEKLKTLCPEKIVYISCDPATLARDLKILSEKYAVETVQPFDMFPQTSHVETVVLLKRISN